MKFAPQNFNDFLAVMYLPFLMLWFCVVGFLVFKVGTDSVETLGLGTATGVFLTGFSNMWQFYFRQRPPKE